jgi:hypothetical protein
MASSTDTVNLDLLIKLLKKSQGDSDEESLLAIRAANKQLEKVGGDWETLLRGKVKIIADPFSNLPPVTVRKAEPPSRPQPKPQPRPSNLDPVFVYNQASVYAALREREARKAANERHNRDREALERKVAEARAETKAKAKAAILDGPPPSLDNL